MVVKDWLILLSKQQKRGKRKLFKFVQLILYMDFFVRYMQRRLVKSLEDLCCQYDSTVRNSTGEIIQFVYGGDGLDPTYMEAKDRPVDFQRSLEHIKAASPYADEDPLDHVELQQAFDTIMETDQFKSLGIDFKVELRYFVRATISMLIFTNVFCCAM